MSAKINILLIEDNPGDAKLVEIYLRESPSINFNLTHVTRLSQAVTTVQKHRDFDFDIVLLDLSLPDSTGFRTLTRAMEKLPKSTSIVVLTGLDDESLGVRAVELGAQDYLVKGQIDTNTLTRAVLHAIKRSKMQRKLSETARHLKTSEQRLLQAQRIAQIGNYELEVNTEKMYWSEEIFRILAYPATQQTPTLDQYLARVPETDLAELKKVIQKAIDSKAPYRIEHRISVPYGGEIKYKHVRNQGQVEVDQWQSATKLIGTIQDISDYKETEAALEESQGRYQTVFEESQDAIYIMSTDGRFLDYNNSLIKLFGYTEQEFTQLRADDLRVKINNRSGNFLKEVIAKQGQQRLKDYQVGFQKKSGETIVCLITSTPWKSAGGVRGYHGIIRDITALKQNQELLNAKEVAERSARLKEQFLANMSHEIRTPMNVVIGMTHLLQKTHLTSKQSDYLEALSKSSDLLLKLINNILDFSKIESGKLTLENRPFKIHELINDLVHTYKYKVAEKKLSLFTQIDVNLPDVIVGDSHHLNQILGNLISNAIKYTDKGEILIRAAVLEHDEEHIYLKFSVRDTGIGIAPDKQKTIFESFRQASEDTTRLYGGTGLGLSIAKELVQLFGGQMILESELGRGSTFSFDAKFQTKETIEAPKPAEPDTSKTRVDLTEYSDVKVIEDQVAADANSDVGQVSGRTDILLVEDHRLNQIVATDFLKRWSADVHIDIAQNGKEAIDILQEKVYDVILMDISMPIMDGYATTIHIRQKMPSPIKDIPIIAMTAHAFNRNAERCFEVGMNEFVSKPIRPKILYAKLNKILADRINQKNTTMNGTSQNGTHPTEAPTPVPAKKLVNLDYLDTLAGGLVDLKIDMLETMVNDLPGEVSKIETDYAARDWEALKRSAHKMKSTCAYMGMEDMQEVARKIENDSWERKNLDTIGQKVNQLSRVCKLAYKELQTELDKLKQVQYS